DLVPFKTCSYDCIYCQLGRTTEKTIERKEYVPAAEVMEELKLKLSSPPEFDYISLAGSGEPTLNSKTGEIVRFAKGLTDVPVAVITNGSLLWMPEVAEELMAADLVIPSLDAGDEKLFRHVNRPHPGISFDRMVDGIASFTSKFKGEVWLEVFLLGGITGIAPEVKKIASLVERIAPARVQINTVARPAAEDYAFAITKEQVEEFCRLMPSGAEAIGVFENAPFPGASGEVASEEAMLALLSRRPCTVKDISEGLGIAPQEVVKVVDQLIAAKKIKAKRETGGVYYIPA
ncbi:MAG TPA: radical SAM protein, partial [bacterium]|nr:radical SAM protein [bacterium]